MLKYIQVTIYTLFLALLSTGTVLAMSSSNYQIDWDTVNPGGTESSSDNYSVDDSLGQVFVDTGSSPNYSIESGYQLTDFEGSDVLLFNIGSQTDLSQTAYTAFDDSGNAVTVATTTNFSVYDMILVVEDRGENQKIAVGRIMSINAGVLTVDGWDGDNAEMSLNPGGDDDYVYVMSGNILDFGTLNYQEVKVKTTYVEVSTNISDGYTVYVREDHDPQSESNAIGDVGDDNVTAGNGEYGLEAVGQDAYRNNDWALTGEKKIVSQNAAVVEDSRTGVMYKITGGMNIPEGSYSHTVSYYCTPNY